MSRAFHELGDDPDIAIYERILKKEKWKEQKELLRTLKSRFESPKQLALPAARPSARVQKTRKARTTNEVRASFYIGLPSCSYFASGGGCGK